MAMCNMKTPTILLSVLDCQIAILLSIRNPEYRN